MKVISFLAASAFPALATAYFYCPSVNATGFNPSCCHQIVGQVGVWCVGAHLIGGEPNWDCNNGPPLNVEGCCQSLNYTNPNTGYSLHLCTQASQPRF
ncbi:hypothetical protein ACRALDRAFT_2094118 [Sodiomyces alcalophilus JCM 7366]|uniref:uncharacterized protein n=1 Tax=Sodiomyces alcalophilus JCM 7366 TaxID=591952 RepID=UPI0039B6D7C6